MVEATTTATAAATTRTTAISWGRLGWLIAVPVVAIAATYWCWRVSSELRGEAMMPLVLTTAGRTRNLMMMWLWQQPSVGATTPAAAATQDLEKA